MKKTVLAPELDDTDAEGLETTVSARGVVIHHDGYRNVVFSGVLWPNEGVEEQTRTLLSYVREVICEDLGGSMDDVTMLRWYVREDALTPENRARMHEVRAEFFDLPQYPASSMVGVADLVADDALVELEAEAEIPDDGWTVEVLSPDEE